MKTPRKRRDGARPAVPPDVESRPTGAASRMRRSVDERRADRGLAAPSGLPKGLADAWAEFAAWSATEPFDLLPGWQVDVESAQDPNAHQKRLASKAAYNKRRSADGAFRKKERERRRKWGRNNRNWRKSAGRRGHTRAPHPKRINQARKLASPNDRPRSILVPSLRH
jgi:hypothetical protein